MNPITHALLAALYIVTLVKTIEFFSTSLPAEDTIFIPMVMLGLFVLSAAVMGFLFLYKPFQLHFDNKKREAVIFFGQTVGVFAGLVAVLAVIMVVFS